MDELQKPQAKKQWQKPELVVLVRSKPEEMVLSNCKMATGKNTSSGTFATGCLYTSSKTCNSNCATITTS